MLFLRKTDETIWKLSFLREPPISEQYFHDSPLCPNFKNETSRPNFREEETRLLLEYQCRTKMVKILDPQRSKKNIQTKKIK